MGNWLSKLANGTIVKDAGGELMSQSGGVKEGSEFLSNPFDCSLHVLRSSAKDT